MRRCTLGRVHRRLVALVALALIAGPPSGAAAASRPLTKPAAKATTKPAPKRAVRWMLAQRGWQASGGTPPACPTPLRLSAPVDLAKVTSILYPGQFRGGVYKPHGGFRLDGTPNDAVQVRLPLAGSIVRGARYLAEGEVQYTFDVVHPCGIMVRVGHLAALPKDMQAIAGRWPTPSEDSRTSWVEPPVAVAQGHLVGTAVGIRVTANTFFDLGVYDLRRTNPRAQDAAWRAAHAGDRELGWHAVCWLDLLSPADRTRALSLPPGDPTSGRSSDFCK